MNVISKKTVRDAIKIYPDSSEQLSLLYRDLKKKIFENVNQVKECFPYVSVLKNNRVVFNVCGNKYRVVVLFNFNVKVCYVRFIGTHADYDKIDANSV